MYVPTVEPWIVKRLVIRGARDLRRSQVGDLSEWEDPYG